MDVEYQIPPALPCLPAGRLSKREESPLFQKKEGVGEIFTTLCLFNYGLFGSSPEFVKFFKGEILFVRIITSMVNQETVSDILQDRQSHNAHKQYNFYCRCVYYFLLIHEHLPT